jgi:hypothetical protein
VAGEDEDDEVAINMSTLADQNISRGRIFV